METETMTLPAIGDKLIALHVPGWSTFNGQVFTVTGVDSTSPIRAYGEFMSEDGRTETLYVEKWVPESTINNDSRVVDLTAQVDQLKQELRDAKYAYDELFSKTETDFENFSESLNEQARYRNWCDEFDQIIESVNSRLIGPHRLTKRESDFEVEWVTRIEIDVPRSALIRGYDEEEALEKAQELDDDDLDAENIVDQIRSGNYQIANSCDYSASEV